MWEKWSQTERMPKRVDADAVGEPSALEMIPPSKEESCCDVAESCRKATEAAEKLWQTIRMVEENRHHASKPTEVSEEECCKASEAQDSEGGRICCCVCGSTEDVRRCSRCKVSLYCSKKCQVAHKEQHEKWCFVMAGVQEVEEKKRYGTKTVRQKQIDGKTQSKMLKLVGEKPMLKCFLEGKEFNVLWDTGSMVSLVSRKWLATHFPNMSVIDVAEFLGKELSLTAANKTVIHFDGVVILKFTLGDEDGFLVPVLVSSGDVSDPILGYNVIEHLLVHGSEEQKSLLKESLKNGERAVEVDMLAAAMEEKYNDPDFLTDIKAASDVKVPAGRKMQIKCRVKATGNGCDETVYFQPRLGEEDEELTFNDSICRMRHGRTNYVYVDVLNQTKRDRVLRKGEVIGSVHSVAAVIPMVRSVRSDQVQSGAAEECLETKVKVEVSGVDGVAEEEKTGSGAGPKWDLSHLEGHQRKLMEDMLERNKEVFSVNDSDIGNIPDFKMPIHLVDDKL